MKKILRNRVVVRLAITIVFLGILLLNINISIGTFMDPNEVNENNSITAVPIWRDHNNNFLDNNSGFSLSYYGVWVVWPQIYDYMNLSLLKGDSTTRSAVLDDDQVDISYNLPVVEGDSYSFDLNWNNSELNLDWTFKDNNGEVVKGCDYSAENLYPCPTDEQPMNMDYLARFTGDLNIRINRLTRVTNPVSRATLFDFQMSNVESDFQEDTNTDRLFINVSQVFNDNILLVSHAKIGALVESANITLIGKTWQPPEINTFTVNGINNSCLSVPRNTLHSLSWQVADNNINEEILKYTLSYLNPNISNNYEVLVSDIPNIQYLWDNTDPDDYPKGDYLFKLVVDDGKFLRTAYNNFFLEIDPEDDFDGDIMPSIWECNNGLNPRIDETNGDFDNDGMTNTWEYLMNLNVISDDSILDNDGDGMWNSYEFEMAVKSNFTSFNASDPSDGTKDYDNDGMPNFWEFQNRLDATDPSDGLKDADNDNMTNIYEYQMGLNALWNKDAFEDKDKDNLTNLQEYIFGSWANTTDSDNDGMSDLYEFNNNLLPLFDDTGDDKDHDGMPNGWEARYGFKANSSADAGIDSDGDGILNINEFLSGTNPRDFFSVPLVSASNFHLAMGIFTLSLGIIIILAYVYEMKRRKILVLNLNAPDYQTARIIRSAKYEDFSEYNLAIEEASRLRNEADAYYYNGNYLDAIQRYEQALAVHVKLKSKYSIAELVLSIVRAQRRMNILSSESSILLRFPKISKDDAQLKSIYNMIQALIAETEGNWGSAQQLWETIKATPETLPKYKLYSQGEQLDIRFRFWVNEQVKADQENLKKELLVWKKQSLNAGIYENVCKANILLSKVFSMDIKLIEMDKVLTECETIARDKNFQIYVDIAKKERKKYYELIKIIDPEEQLPPEKEKERVDGYLKMVRESLQKELER